MFLYNVVPSQHMTLRRRRTDIDATSSHRIDVSTTLFRRHVLAGSVSILKKKTYGTIVYSFTVKGFAASR